MSKIQQQSTLHFDFSHLFLHRGLSCPPLTWDATLLGSHFDRTQATWCMAGESTLSLAPRRRATHTFLKVLTGGSSAGLLNLPDKVCSVTIYKPLAGAILNLEGFIP
jgi:hypothetical protein